MTCTLSWYKVSQQLEERCLEFRFEKHGCAKSLVHNVCCGALDPDGFRVGALEQRHGTFGKTCGMFCHGPRYV